MIYIILLILGFIILYNIIKFKCTEYRYEDVVVLKNELTSDWVGGTGKPFNLIGDIPGLMGCKVYIEKRDKYVFNKLEKTEFTIQQSFADDSEHD